MSDSRIYQTCLAVESGPAEKLNKRSIRVIQNKNNLLEYSILGITTFFIICIMLYNIL